MISVITITCRHEPGYQELADSLAMAAKVPFEWVVVDEILLWPNHPERLETLRAAVADRFSFQHIQPTLSPVRLAGFPDPCRARNIGLLAAEGDYAVFLDDNMAVTAQWLVHVNEARERGWGFRSHLLYQERFESRSMEKNGHRWKPMKPTQCSGIFGAPMNRLLEIGGFDEAYAGEMAYEDLDAVLRLSQRGLAFYGTRASCAFHFPHPKIENPCDTQRLGKNRERFLRRLEARHSRPVGS